MLHISWSLPEFSAVRSKLARSSATSAHGPGNMLFDLLLRAEQFRQARITSGSDCFLPIFSFKFVSPGQPKTHRLTAMASTQTLGFSRLSAGQFGLEPSGTVGMSVSWKWYRFCSSCSRRMALAGSASDTSTAGECCG